MSLPAGTRFGPYETVTSLATGGMGEVFVAADQKLHRSIALKVLIDRDLAGDRRRRHLAGLTQMSRGGLHDPPVHSR